MSVATIGSILNAQQLLSADVSTARIAVWLTLCHSWFGLWQLCPTRVPRVLCDAV